MAFQGDGICFCRAENDVGGVVSLAARLSRLVPNAILRPADAITILSFFPSSFWLKFRRQKTNTGQMAVFSVGPFFRGMVFVLFRLLPPTCCSSFLVYK